MFENGISWGFPFLPYGAEMLYTQDYPSQPRILLTDLNKDGKNELIGVYRLNQQLFLFVLHEHFGHIRLITAALGHGYNISYLGTAHIKSPDKLSIVIGWQLDPIWSKLEIFDWKRSGLKELNLTGDFHFSKIEIEDMPGAGGRDGKDEIALWLPDTGDSYRINIYRWEDNNLVRARDVEPYYFKKVAAYYRKKTTDPYMGDGYEKLGWDARTVYLFPACQKEVGGTKWGYIDAKGKFVLPPTYGYAGDFQENNLAIVLVKDHYGVIDSKGYFVVKPKYGTIAPFSEGRAVVTDQQGTKVIDESGKEITSRPYSQILDFQERRAVIYGKTENGEELYGYLNRLGKEVIPLKYKSAQPFTEGKAVVKRMEGRYALINLTGNIIKEYHYALVQDYGEGLVAFKQTDEGKYGYIDEQGNIVIKPEYSWANGFSDGKAVVAKDDGNRDLYGLINKQGQYLIRPIYHNLLGLGEGRYALGKAINPDAPYEGSNYAIADAHGRLLTGFIYTDVKPYQDDYASATNGKSTFFIDRNGKRAEQLPMVTGDGKLEFDKTLLKGELNGRLMYFNHQGELIWKPNTVIHLRDKLVVIEHKFYPNKDYLVYYPQISGMTEVNNKLKEMAGVKEIPSDVQLESSYGGDFEVTFFQKNLLVIEITGYDYPFGAAHGMPIQKYAHINVAMGDMYHLKDLFKDGADYVKVISGMIDHMIKTEEQYEYLFKASYKGIAWDQPFFISEGGLNIFFTPYDIGPFAAGFPTFHIPFEKLKQIIDYSSGFWTAFH